MGLTACPSSPPPVRIYTQTEITPVPYCKFNPVTKKNLFYVEAVMLEDAETLDSYLLFKCNAVF